MLFNSFPFMVFFFVLYLVLRATPRRFIAPTLLGASLLFYAAWHPVYLLLLLAEVAANYLLMRWMLRSQNPRAPLVLSIVLTMGVLAWFKYSALAVETALPILQGGMGLQIEPPDFFLPLGISFYSFQIIALMVDVQRRNIDPPASFSRFLLFVVFFPQLIAGPIVRGAELLPQLDHGGEVTSERSRRGVWLIVSGLLKKVVIGDFLLASFVDEVFATPGVGGAGHHWIGLYSFAFQIYFDFSGYTDMARGLACLLGFELPLNFREPYLSRDPSEFWRRWHMTLSTWLRDYLYIPLGGNRHGPVRTYLALILTMLLGGLWHGAAWNFVVWGGAHGLLLVLYRLWPRKPAPGEQALRWMDLPGVLVFFHIVCLLWVFFRASTFAEALDFFGALFTNFDDIGVPVLQTLIVAVCAGLHWLERVVRERRPALQALLAERAWGPLVEGAIIGIILALSIAFSGSGEEFIYFQF